MNTRKLPIVLLSFLLLGRAGIAGAETRYITDQSKIMMRAGEGSRFKILRRLPSGYPVEVLSANKKTGYAHVRVKSGKTGYVLLHQLMNEPSARERLAVARQRLDELQAEPDKLAARLSTLQTENAELSSARQQLQQERDDLTKQLEALRHTSANAVRISNERNELRKKQVSLIQQIEELKQENQELSNTAAQKWLLNGALVTLGGILIGLLLPRLRFQRRKNSWGSL